MSSNECVSRGDIDALGERIAGAAACVGLATHRLLTDIRAFDEVGGWHRHGAKSCATWLSWRAGISLGPAREHVRVAAKLGAFPAVDAAMATGALSYSKARALTRVVTEANVDLLLQLAGEMTAAQLEQTCRKLRRVQANSDVEEPAVERRRYLRTRDTDDGMVSIELRLRPDEAARVVKAIEAAAESAPLIDGAIALAEAALRGDKPTRTPVDVTVHIDASRIAKRFDGGRRDGDLGRLVDHRLFRAQRLRELTRRFELLDDVASSDELTANVKLRNGGPLGVLLDALADRGIAEHVDGRVIGNHPIEKPHHG